MNSLSKANTHFALDLFQQFKISKKDDNIFYSPFSIASSLAMTLLGAKENTALEIRKVEKLGNVHHQFQKLLTELKKPTDAYELNIANKLYGENNYPFLQEYMDNVKKFFLASVESVDFNKEEESRKKINSWVESQTNGKNTSKCVQMMKQSGVFNFTSLEDAQAKILEMPYKGKDLSMMLLLPNKVDGLQKLEDQLTAEKLTEWTSSENMSNRQVDLHLPRFKVEDGYDLKATLGALGMMDTFSKQSANFSSMTGSLDLMVSKVLHKSFVEVTEEGTKAAASTVINVGLTSPPTYRFHCNHPFLFFIKHKKTDCILFLGRVSSP